MDLRDKLPILADAAKYDASCASSGSKSTRAGSRIGSTERTGICHSYTPDGRCVSLLKILLTNYCIYDCKYCINRVSSDTPRARFTVEEVVRLTLDFYQRNYIEGLFLSSGVIRSPDHTMEQMVRVAKLLRQEHKFGGYIHLKGIAGASDGLIYEAGEFADRVSVNIELPTEPDLKKLAPEKNKQSIDGAMKTLHDEIADRRDAQRSGLRPPRFAPAGQSTQMIVGATETPDREVLRTATGLYRRHGMRRVYYSAYSPTPSPDDRLPAAAPPLQREHRLYQADWLLRFYGFDAEELVTGADGNLSLEFDPKTAWALSNRHLFPVDVNRASREELLRVPGFGVRGVGKIINARRYRQLRSDDVRKLGVVWKRAAAFVTTTDSNDAVAGLDSLSLSQRLRPCSKQLALFDTGRAALSGEL